MSLPVLPENVAEKISQPSPLADSKALLTPKEIVQELDQHIIGQHDAKRAVAIALRNRWRRQQLSNEELRKEVTPKNILMIGPTGVGKTEIARRLAKLANAPFIKVEATKFTEVGYVGRDVDSIIRDLVDMAIKLVREQVHNKVKEPARKAAEERILDVLLPTPKAAKKEESEDLNKHSATRLSLRERLQNGDLDEREIEIDISSAAIGIEIMTPPGMEEMSNQLQTLFQNLAGERTKTRKLRIKEALKILSEEEAAKLINDDDLKTQALQLVEQNGIVFIDEIDKVAESTEHGMRSGISREGVQRDLLPLVEGCTVSTRYGMVKTDHMLFICSGAFHLTKPSDLIPELQGRLPIRVELAALTAQDFVRILTEPKASLIEQYSALLATEGVNISFAAAAIERIAEIAWQVNERTENIGARRLHTILERLLESISFTASDRAGDTVDIDAAYVDEQLSALAQNEDLSRYIL